MSTFISEYFGLDQSVLDGYGAFNVSVVNDLPVFIDPFLLFNSTKPEYQKLHDDIIKYLIFLRDKAKSGANNKAMLKLWYCFPEVKQNWLGFSVSGNSGSGLALKFAYALHGNLHKLLSDFGKEEITESSHLEKICLIANGVGRDNISDFTTNLIKDYLCRFTEGFATQHLRAEQTREVAIQKAKFNYDTESWEFQTYRLPWVNNDFVILTPRDMLTRDDNWINKSDLISGFEKIPPAIPDSQLREQVANYFRKVLVRHEDKEPSWKERGEAVARTVMQFPALIDYYIRMKEEGRDEASSVSASKVAEVEELFIRSLGKFQSDLALASKFYSVRASTYEEAHERLGYLKDFIENKGGHRIFYVNGEPFRRESDLQILYSLVWFGTPSDVTTEANDGRGPVDFKVTRGSKDKTLVEMKLAKNSKLEQNLKYQLEIYQKASNAKRGIKAIVYFTHEERQRVLKILEKLGLHDSADVVLIDARDDNKPSGSKAH